MTQYKTKIFIGGEGALFDRDCSSISRIQTVRCYLRGLVVLRRARLHRRVVLVLARAQPLRGLIERECGAEHNECARQRDLVLHRLSDGRVGAKEHRLLLTAPCFAALSRFALRRFVRIIRQRILLALLAQPRLRRRRGQLTVGVDARSELAFPAALAQIARLLLRAHRIRLCRIAVAAARLDRVRRLRVRTVGVGARTEFARVVTLTLRTPDLIRAHFILLHALAVATAELDRRRGRRGRGHFAVRRIVGDEERTAHRLTFRLRSGARAFVIRFVAVLAVAAARGLSRRLRRRGPHRFAVLVLAERLEHTARGAVAIRQHRALALSAELFAFLHPTRAVADRGVSVATARILGRLRQRELTVLLNDAKRNECARRAAVALVGVLNRIARVVRSARSAFAAAGNDRRRRRFRRGQNAVVLVFRLQKLAAFALAHRAVQSEALRLRFVRRGVATARRFGRGRRGRPYRFAVLVLAERLE